MPFASATGACKRATKEPRKTQRIGIASWRHARVVKMRQKRRLFAVPPDLHLCFAIKTSLKCQIPSPSR